MLTNENRYSDIQVFLSKETFLLGASKNKVFDLLNNELITEFKENVLKIVSDGRRIYTSDIYGNGKVLLNNKILELEYPVTHVFGSGNCICHLRNPKRTALLNNQWEIIWELDFRSLEFVYDEELIYLRDRRDEENNIIVAVSLESGKKVWNKSLKDFERGKDFGRFIGIHGSDILFATRHPEAIIVLNKDTGNVSKIFGSEIIEEYDTSIEYFKLDKKNNKLVNPHGEIELNTQVFNPTNLKDQFKDIDLSVPGVYPFTFDDNFIFFGVQKHIAPQTKKYRCIGELLVLDRQTGDVVYSQKINDKKEDAGIKQIELYNDKLYVLDSFGYLTTYMIHC